MINQAPTILRPAASRALLWVFALALATAITTSAEQDQPQPQAAAQAPVIARIIVEGNTLLPEQVLIDCVRAFEGRPLTVEELQAAAAKVQEMYVRRGYATTRVVVPPQEVKDGIVRLRVLEGRVGAVTVEGNRYFSTEHNYLPYLPSTGEPLNLDTLKRNLRYLNVHPDIKADAVLTPGKEPQTTDVVLHAAERHPYHVSLRADNAGAGQMSSARAYLTLQYDNLFDRSQILLVQAGTTPWDWSQLRQYVISYYVPLAPLGGPLGHSITAYAGYSSAASQAVSELFTLGGKGTVVGAQYNLPLPDIGDVVEDLTLGAEYQQTETVIGMDVTEIKNEVRSLPLSARWSASCRHNDGVTSGYLGVRWQRDGLLCDFDRSAYAREREGAGTSFLIGTVGLQRLQHLGRGWTCSLRAGAQLADDQLLPSYQLGLGGYDTVRGYRQRAAVGDEGLNAGLEVRTPVLPHLLPERFGDQTQLLGFLDYGRVHRLGAPSGQPGSDQLLGVGVGARASLFDSGLTARADLGWALTDIASTSHNEPGDCLLHFGIECRF